MPSASPKTHTPICPKCGYDQSGIIATWTDRCPLQGTCPECGLIIEWTKVLNPDHITLEWYSEHAQSLLSAFKRTPNTFLQLSWPNRFWKRVTVFMQIKLSMLIRWSLSLIVLAHLVSSIVTGFGRWAEQDWYTYGALNRDQQLGFLDFLSLTSNALFAPLVTMYPSRYDGSLNIHWYTYGYETTTDYILVASFPFGATLLWVIILAVIPTTRRIAKLRTQHIYRALIIAATSCALLFELGRIVQSIIMFNNPIFDYLIPVLGVCVILTSIWHFLFWPAAIIIGWKIRPAFLLVTFGTIAAFLGAFTLSLVISLIH